MDNTDYTKPEWLLLIYITIAMTFFTAVGYSIGDVMQGITVGVQVSLVTCVVIGVKTALDYTASMSLNKQEK